MAGVRSVGYPVSLEVVVTDGRVEYAATVPGLPGCAAAGDTPYDALEALAEGVRLWVADARRRGIPMPELSVYGAPSTTPPPYSAST